MLINQYRLTSQICDLPSLLKRVKCANRLSRRWDKTYVGEWCTQEYAMGGGGGGGQMTMIICH